MKTAHGKVKKEFGNGLGARRHVGSVVHMVMNTKGKRDRIVPMTSRLQELFEGMKKGAANSLVFPNGKGEVHRQVPSAFVRAMEDSGLNSEVDDPKLKATFHTTRHTFGSRMVQQGVDFYTLQKLMGHSTPVLTARYAKLADSNLREAVAQMEKTGAHEGKEGERKGITSQQGGKGVAGSKLPPIFLAVAIGFQVIVDVGGSIQGGQAHVGPEEHVCQRAEVTAAGKDKKQKAEQDIS